MREARQKPSSNSVGLRTRSPYLHAFKWGAPGNKITSRFLRVCAMQRRGNDSSWLRQM